MPANENPLMLFLDENLPKGLWKTLRAAGYSAARPIDEGLRGKHDSVIFRQQCYRLSSLAARTRWIPTSLPW